MIKYYHEYINNNKSNFREISAVGLIYKKGYLKALYLAPCYLNIFINDIFYFIEYGTLYNYADDNTLSYVNDNYEKLINILEKKAQY